MTDPYWKFNLISLITTSATSLPGLAVGPGRLNSQDGIQMNLFGLQASPANRFRAQDSSEEKKTSATSGRHSSAWLKSADLQLSLENRLRQRMGVNGSPEYKLTWKRWDIPARPPICRLQASAHRTSETGFSGWRTPRMNDYKGGVNGSQGSQRKETDYLLPDQVSQLVGWPTPNCMDTLPPKEGEALERNKKKGGCSNLREHVQLVGWPTPNHNTTGPGNQGREGGENLQTAVQKIRFDCECGATSIIPNLETPCTECTRILSGTVTYLDSGIVPPSSPAPTEKAEGYLLNPKFSLWLQGYEIEWGYCGERVTASARKSRQSS